MTANVESSGTVSVEHTTPSGQTLNIQSNTGTEAQVRESLSIGEPEVEVTKTDGEGNISKAASELGKKGGEAAAKARAKAAKEARKAEKEAKDAESEDSDRTPEAWEDKQSSSEADVEEAPKPAGKDRRGDPRHDPTARVAEATRAASEARKALEAERREKAELARRLEEVERRTATPEEKAAREREVDPRKEPEPPGRPQPEDYATHEEWLTATLDWRDEIKEIKREIKAKHDQENQRIWDQEEKLSEILNEAVSSDESIRKRISPEIWALKPSADLPKGVRPSAKHGIADVFMDRPHITIPMGLYFTENPDEFQRIASLRTPDELRWEMAKLEAKVLDAAPTGTSATDIPVSRAKPPIRPVSGEALVADDGGELYKPGESLDQFAARWRKNATNLRRR